MHKKAKIVLGSLLLLLLAAYFIIQMQKPLELGTEILSKKSLIRDFKESAKTKTELRQAITPAYSASIRFIGSEGQSVTKGELILSLDSSDLLAKRAELAATQASLIGQEKMSSPSLHQSQIEALDIGIKTASEQLQRLDEDLKKHRSLYESGAIAEVEYEKVRRAREDAASLLALKEKEKSVLLDQSREKAGTGEFYANQRKAIGVQIEELDRKIARSKVYAPIDGVLINIQAKKGGFASPGMPIMEIEGKEGLIAVCEVLASDALALSEGQPVRILEKVGEETLEKKGSVLEIGKYARTRMSSLGLEEQRVEIKIGSEEFSDAIIGSDMDIVFETLHLDNVLVVPKSSVFEAEDQKYVWTIRDDLLQKMRIETGRESDYDCEVLSGLSEGDILVLEPNNDKLKEGAKAVSSE